MTQALFNLIYSFFRPRPNGDQAIVLAAAGVAGAMTIPTGTGKAIITNPVACWVRFGATPAVNAGTYYAANQGIVLESPEEVDQAQIYVTGAATLFVQYYK